MIEHKLCNEAWWQENYWCAKICVITNKFIKYEYYIKNCKPVSKLLSLVHISTYSFIFVFIALTRCAFSWCNRMSFEMGNVRGSWTLHNCSSNLQFNATFEVWNFECVVNFRTKASIAMTILSRTVPKLNRNKH